MEVEQLVYDHLAQVTCGVAVQNSFHHFTLLRGTALPWLAGDVVIAVAFAAFGAVFVGEPGVSDLQGRAEVLSEVFSWKTTENELEDQVRSTYRSVLSVFIVAPTLTEGDTFVPTQDQAGAAHTTLHAGLVAGAAGAHGVLTAGLGARRATWVVVAAWGALQSCRKENKSKRLVFWRKTVLLSFSSSQAGVRDPP